MSRPAPEGLRRNNFDLLRLFAALQVVLLHSYWHLDLPTHGPAWAVRNFFRFFPGVPIFFVISGYLVSRSWERVPDVRRYARHRLLRIYPPLWAAFGVTLLIAVGSGAIGSDTVRTGTFWVWVAGQLSFVQVFNPSFLREFGVGVINGSLWTIPVELVFYGFVPVVYWAAITRTSRRAGNVLLVVLAAGSFAIYQYGLGGRDHDNVTLGAKVLDVTILPHLHLFLAGMLLQRNEAWSSRWLDGRGLVWSALLIGYMVVLHGAGLISPDPTGVATLGQRILLALWTVSMARSSPGLAARILGGRDLSYGVYLYHMLVVNVLVEAGLRGRWDALGVAFVGTLALALASWTFVEWPTLRSRSRADRDGAGDVTGLGQPIR